MFDYSLLQRFDVEQVNAETGRTYKTPAGQFPSVTTVLKKHFGDDVIQAWRDSVGHEYADGITQQASNQGDNIHHLLEDYLWQRQTNQKVVPLFKALFLKYRKFLDENLTRVYGIEHPLFSNNLKAAGTADLVARFHDRWNAVADFKTIRKLGGHNLNKEAMQDRVHKYHLQCTTYAIMIEELYKMRVPYNVILIGCFEEHKIVPNISLNDKYRDEVYKIFKEGHENLSIPTSC